MTRQVYAIILLLARSSSLLCSSSHVHNRRQKQAQGRQQKLKQLTTTKRKLFESLAGYQPRTLITNHAAIDLDQQAMEERLSLKQLAQGRSVYEKGGYSKSIACLNLIDPTGPRTFKKGTSVYAMAKSGDNPVTGFLNDTYSWGTGTGQNKTIFVEYFTSSIQSRYSNCHVGGLYMFGGADEDGCFKGKGALTIELTEFKGENYQYTYLHNSVRLDNINGRTLKSLGTTAKDDVKDCKKCEYDDFEIFTEYYGTADYANRWIMAAFNKEATNFPTARGEANFTYSPLGLAEVITRSTVVLSSYMKIILLIQKAIEDCFNGCVDGECSSDGANALDVAFAFYAGSLEEGGDGKMLYALADKRASDFHTAGPSSIGESGTSYVNTELLRQMKRAQQSLSQLKCDDAVENKANIVNLMKIPLVQSVLRFAYIRRYNLPKEKDNQIKMEAEGATFAAALLPYLHSCNPDDAELIYNNMKVGSKPGNIDFPAIKSALERNYHCLGFTCNHVGGLWSIDQYAPGAEPCKATQTSTSSISEAKIGKMNKKGGSALLSIIFVSLLVAVAFTGFTRLRRYRRAKHAYRPPSRNIAAVSEIA